jgi:hypothetical protein
MLVLVLLFVILGFSLIAIDSRLNRFVSSKIMQDGTVLPYTTLQHIYPIDDQQRPIYIFFHICTQGEHWKNILDTQMKTIINSGLYHKCNTIWYGCSCQSCEELLVDYFAPFKKVFPLPRAMCSNQKTYENNTLNSMIRFCQHLSNTADCLYIHTKATTAKSKAQHSWREFMMYWMVERHDIAIDLLHRDFYTVGTLYQKLPFIVYGYNRLYSGNFFWGSSDYIKQLPMVNNTSNRFLAEYLIFKRYIRGKHASINSQTFVSIYMPFKTGLYKDCIKITPITNDKLRILIV